MSSHHFALLVFVNICWGFNFIVGKWGTELFGSLTFSVLRFVIVLALLFPFLRWIPGQMRSVVLIGFILGACHYSIMFLSMYLTENISSVAVAAQLVVPFSTLLAIIFLGERIGWPRAVAIGLAFIGVVIIGFEPIGTGPKHSLALVLSVTAALAMAVTTTLMRNLSNVGVFNLQAWIALIAIWPLAGLAVVFEPAQLSRIAALPMKDYWLPLYSAVAATIVGHGAFYWLLQRFPVSQVAPFITLSSLFAVLFGVTLLGDAMTVKIVVGALLTLTGVTVVAVRNADSPDKPS